MRAIGMSRAIHNIIFLAAGGSIIPPEVQSQLAAIRSQLLGLPAKGTFSSGISGPAGFVRLAEWIKQADNARKIDFIISNETKPNGLVTFVNRTNALLFDQPFSPAILSHHLFVAELAHELGWPSLVKSESFPL